jgi:hypothetical protein
LKLNAALLLDRRLLDRDHLPLHLRQLGCRLIVANDKERGRFAWCNLSACASVILKSSANLLCKTGSSFQEVPHGK